MEHDGRSRQPYTAPGSSGLSAFSEPEVRRWPHPVKGVDSASSPDAALHYIHCALSYQNQLLADILSILEQLTADPSPAKK